MIKENKSKRIINRFKINKCLEYICFLYIKKRNNIENILLDEGMNVIIEKLDNIIIFRKINRDEGIQTLLKVEEIEMSELCKTKINKIINKVSN